MQYVCAKNIDVVLGLNVAAHLKTPVHARVSVVLDSMWDAAVNEKHGTNWPNAMQPDVGTKGVVIVTTDDMREFAMSLAGTAKQLIQLALTNPNTMAALTEIIDGANEDIKAADYIMTTLEGYGSHEQFILYSNTTDLP